MSKQPYISTGQAAKLLGVTPDAILKWIKRGRLTAVRTAGGHFRVRRDQVDALIQAKSGSAEAERKALHCWEYHAFDGKLRDECAVCLVHTSRALRCYELSRHPKEMGFTTCFAFKGRCRDCGYYRTQVHAPVRLLVVTDDTLLRDRLSAETGQSRYQVEFCSNAYDCSSTIERFRPEIVLLDGALAVEFRTEMCTRLSTDPRVPDVRIVQTAPPGRPRSKRPVAIVLELPASFTLDDLDRAIATIDEGDEAAMAGQSPVH